MKKLIAGALMASALLMAPLGAHAIDLKDIFGKVGSAAGQAGSKIGDAVTGVVTDFLTNDDITVKQMSGTWKITGSAVDFQSENLLKKAGGSAVSTTIEKQLNNYYNKFGLLGGVLTVTEEGDFTLNAGKLNLTGSVTKREDGNFDFTFKPFGGIALGSMKAYVTKPPKGLNVMFDASKLLSILSYVSGLTGNSTLNSVGSLLSSYDGLCVGFAFKSN